MYLEDSVGNMLLKQLYQKVPDSGTWGGGQVITKKYSAAPVGSNIAITAFLRHDFADF